MNCEISEGLVVQLSQQDRVVLEFSIFVAFLQTRNRGGAQLLPPLLRFCGFDSSHCVKYIVALHGLARLRRFWQIRNFVRLKL